METTPEYRSFVVVFRANSALRFAEDGHLRINKAKTPSGRVDLTFRTRYDDGGLEAKIPRELWIDTRGTAGSIDQAINEFGTMVSTFLPLLCVAENSAILDLDLHLAFENTRTCIERDFIQVFLPDERGIPRLSRKANARAASDFLQSLSAVAEKDRDRVLRACGQYQQALMHWAPGQELLALAHLYMGVEALTEVVLRSECSKHGIDEVELGARLGIPPGSQSRCPSCRRVSDELRPAIRKQLIFRGDEDCYKEAKRASDGFEHGYLGFDELRQLAATRRDHTAAYLRDAIIEVITSDAGLKAELCKKALAFGAWRPQRIFRGALVGSAEDLAAPGQEYPILRWKSSIQKASVTSSGGIAITPTEEITPRLGNGISLRLGAYGVLAPDVGVKRETPPQPLVPKITEGVKHDPARDHVNAILERLLSQVLDYGSGKVLAATATEALTFSIFAECRSQFQAVVVLLKSCLANEALQIAHGLFRNARRLRALTGIENKTPVVFGWLRDSLKSGHEVQKAAVNGGFSEGSPPTETEFAEKMLSLQQLESKFNAALTGFPSEDVNKDEVGALSWLGYLASRRILDGFGAMMSYQKDSVPKGAGFNNICEDTEFIAFAAAFAAESVLLACQSTGQLFDWPEFDGLDHYLAEFRSNEFGKSHTGGSSPGETVSSS